MKTLTITEGRGRLGYWLKKATQGKDIGFMFEGKIVALRPVEVAYRLRTSGIRFNIGGNGSRGMTYQIGTQNGAKAW